LGDGANPLQTAQLKLSMCQQGLSGWSIAKYGSVDKDIQSKNKKLAALHMVEGHENQEQIHQLRGEIDHLLEMEGIGIVTHNFSVLGQTAPSENQLYRENFR
jgi:hypothetical protein